MRRINLICLLLVIISGTLQAKSPVLKFNVVFIGNSITHGSGLKNPITESAPTQAVNYLNTHGCSVQFANCGVGGSTTVDFLPSTNKLFPRVELAADSLYRKGVPLVFSVKLGTNDSAIKGPNGAPVLPEKYKENVQTIIDALQQRYPQAYIVLNCPIWYSPNTHNHSTYMEEGLARLQTYRPQLETLAKENAPHVLMGDKKAFAFFKKNYLLYLNPEQGASGTFYLHPNVSGAQKLGEFWAKVLIRYAKTICTLDNK